MIKITINRNESGLIQSFTMSGHADFAEHGQDIVCAGASAVSFGAVNAIHALTGITPEIEQGEDGFLRTVVFPDTYFEGSSRESTTSSRRNDCFLTND